MTTDQSVYQHIARLRKALGDSADDPQYIETIPRRGYRLVAPVGPVSDADIQSDSARRRVIGPVAAIAVVFLAAGVAFVFQGRVESPGASSARVGTEPRTVIAVLPFENLSEEPQDPYLARAVTLEVRSHLSRVPDFVVLSDYAVKAALAEHADQREALRSLRATHLLRGAVRAKNGKVNLSLELAGVVTNRAIWAETYVQSIDDVSRAPGSVAMAIVNALDAKLAPDEARRIAQARTASLAALQLFHRAREINTGGGRGDTGEELLRQALVLDSDFADAHAELAFWQIIRWRVEGRDVRDADLERLVTRGVDLNPDSAWAQFVLGYWHLYKGEMRAGLHAMRQAEALDPSDRFVLQDLSVILADLGHLEESLAVAHRAVLVAPNAENTRWHLTIPLDRLGRHEQANQWCVQTLNHFQLDTGRYGELLGKTRCQWYRAEFALLNGNADAARTVAHQMLEAPNVMIQMWAVRTLILSGDVTTPVALLGRIVERAPHQRVLPGDISARTYLAYVLLSTDRDTERAHTLLNETLDSNRTLVDSGAEQSWLRVENAAAAALLQRPEEAMDWLNRAYDSGYWVAQRLAINPLFDALKGRADWKRFLDRSAENLSCVNARIDRSGLGRTIDRLIREDAMRSVNNPTDTGG